MLTVLLSALEESLFMVFAAGMLAFLIAFPLTLFQVISQPSHLAPNKLVHKFLSLLFHSSLSIPYVIFILSFIPLFCFTGNNHVTSLTHLEGNCLISIIPLALVVVPVFVREYVKVINQIPVDIIDMAKSFGATPSQIIRKVLIPESSSGIIHSLTLMFTQLIGYSVVAGTLGGGGLGGLWLGHSSFNQSFNQQFKIVFFSAICVIIIIQIIQRTGNYFAYKK